MWYLTTFVLAYNVADGHSGLLTDLNRMALYVLCNQACTSSIVCLIIYIYIYIYISYCLDDVVWK